MNPEIIFLVCNYAVLPAWLLLILAPKWVWTQRLLYRVWIPGVLVLFYILALRPNLVVSPVGFKTEGSGSA